MHRRRPADAVVAAGLGGLGPRATPPSGPAPPTGWAATAAVLVEVDGEDDLGAVHGPWRRRAGRCPCWCSATGRTCSWPTPGSPGWWCVLGPGLAGIEIDGTTVRAGGGAKLPVVARRSAAAGLTGLEWAVGVPGSVGGALQDERRRPRVGHRRRAAPAQRLFDLVTGRGHDGRAGRPRPRLPALVARPGRGGGVGRVRPGTPGTGPRPRQAVADIVRWRREHQPGGSNAGSVFTNPPGDSAGRLVEEAGLKGFRLGTARVSEKHANFIQADDGGSADDVRRLIDHVRAEVARHRGRPRRPRSAWWDSRRSNPQRHPLRRSRVMTKPSLARGAADRSRAGPGDCPRRGGPGRRPRPGPRVARDHRVSAGDATPRRGATATGRGAGTGGRSTAPGGRRSPDVERREEVVRERATAGSGSSSPGWRARGAVRRGVAGAAHAVAGRCATSRSAGAVHTGARPSCGRRGC